MKMIIFLPVLYSLVKVGCLVAVENQKINVENRQSVTLRCNRGETYPEIIWNLSRKNTGAPIVYFYKNGSHDVDRAWQDDVTANKDRSITIKLDETRDVGTILCEGRDGGNTTELVDYTVKYYVRPVIKHITKDYMRITDKLILMDDVAAGIEVVYNNVEASQPINVDWAIDGLVLYTGESVQLIAWRSWHLETLTCTVMNEYANDTWSMIIIVQYEENDLYFIKPPTRLDLSIGETTNLVVLLYSQHKDITYEWTQVKEDSTTIFVSNSDYSFRRSVEATISLEGRDVAVKAYVDSINPNTNDIHVTQECVQYENPIARSDSGYMDMASSTSDVSKMPVMTLRKVGQLRQKETLDDGDIDDIYTRCDERDQGTQLDHDYLQILE